MMRLILALTLLLAASAAHAQQSPEDRYIAERDRLIRQFASAKLDKKTTAAEEKARAGLTQQMRAIVGPVTPPPGFDTGALNLSTLFKGDQGFGTLDGLVFRKDERKRELIVTTRTLLVRWLAGHKTWWKQEPMPPEPTAAFRVKAFWNQAIDTDAHITPFANIPLAGLPLDAPAASAHAVAAGRSQDQLPAGPDEVFVAALKGERAFIAIARFEPELTVASCTDARTAAEKKAAALGERAPPPGKALDALNKRIEAAREKDELDHLRCFGALAAKEPRWAAVVTLAQELYGAMKER